MGRDQTMRHAERIIAEISSLNKAEQLRLLGYVGRLKAARLVLKVAALTAAQARDLDALSVESSPCRVSLAGYKVDREEASAARRVSNEIS